MCGDRRRPVTVAGETDAREWDRYVSARPEASVYHQWRWRHVFDEAFGHETVYLAARREGAIAGVLPLVLFQSRLFGRFIVSLPFVNYGGVVADDDEAADALLSEANRIAADGRFRHVELRHRARRFPALAVKQHKVAMVLPLPATEEEAWNGLDRKVRNQIRKGQKSGAVAAEAGGVEAFYAVFARNMRDLGTPVYSRRFFDCILAHNAGQAAVVTVDLSGETIAAGLVLTHGDTVEVPWAASLAEHRSLCPNHVLYWFVIQRAIASGCRFLDFGRSTPNEGTFHFKKQWGAIASPLYWEYTLLRAGSLPDQSPKNPRFQHAIAAWKRCPVWLTKLAGPHIVRSIP